MPVFPVAPTTNMFTINVLRNSVFDSYPNNADALYAFKSRGFGGEIGLDASETVDYNVPVAVVRENTQLCTYFFNLFTPTY